MVAWADPHNSDKQLAACVCTCTRAEAVKEVVHGVHTVTGGEAERFLARMAQRFPFLHPDRLMDASRRRPGHADYDPRTLFVPPSWFKVRWGNVWGAARAEGRVVGARTETESQLSCETEILGVLSPMPGTQPHTGHACLAAEVGKQAAATHPVSKAYSLNEAQARTFAELDPLLTARTAPDYGVGRESERGPAAVVGLQGTELRLRAALQDGQVLRGGLGLSVRLHSRAGHSGPSGLVGRQRGVG